MRYAIVDNARDEKQVEAYLPGNYEVLRTRVSGGKFQVLIGGEDSAGWTLDDYVIPRLQSGLLWACELDRSDAVNFKLGTQVLPTTLRPER